ncbi:DUF6497 family protein [Sulfitobacter sp. 1A12779]|uniref:DUF6497 family protein n=1 Tax=Sulfitobacter sp. 1A12779 TaxID=3368599 RepID=UPI0037460F8D
MDQGRSLRPGAGARDRRALGHGQGRADRCAAQPLGALLRRAWLPALLAVGLGGPARAIDVPSGQAVDLQEVLVEELGGETWLRFRFIAPQIAKGPGAIAYDRAAPDMEHLCAVVALPYMTEHALAGQVIVVSLADRPVEFGAADPEATQYFEAFRAQDDTCIWEGL